jgi:hypothetical protein
MGHLPWPPFGQRSVLWSEHPVPKAISLGAMIPFAAADPAPRSCRGQFISTPVDVFGPGRRAVAEMFFGDDPHAVRNAERFLQDNISGL